MDWDAIKEFARRWWPDADETWDDPDCQLYYWKQYCRSLQRQRKAA